MFGHAGLLPTVFAVSLLAVACAGTPEEERVSLCEDLGNLASTVASLAAPPQDATVGGLRGATEKLDPTIGRVEDAGVVLEAEREAFRAAQEAVLEALEGTGDETAVADVPADQLRPVAELVARYEEVVSSLGCDALSV